MLNVKKESEKMKCNVVKCEKEGFESHYLSGYGHTLEIWLCKEHEEEL